jgi:predicted RNase H-like nuclease (RuvC/YqgF family)
MFTTKDNSAEGRIETVDLKEKNKALQKRIDELEIENKNLKKENEVWFQVRERMISETVVELKARDKIEAELAASQRELVKAKETILDVIQRIEENDSQKRINELEKELAESKETILDLLQQIERLDPETNSFNNFETEDEQ